MKVDAIKNLCIYVYVLVGARTFYEVNSVNKFAMHCKYLHEVEETETRKSVFR
jgi:hypothetical protein